jgi:hypothetical protein
VTANGNSSEVLQYPEMFDEKGTRRKLVIFTEHRDTLSYLVEKVGVMVGADSVVQIHGSLLREERRKSQGRFLQEPDVYGSVGFAHSYRHMGMIEDLRGLIRGPGQGTASI